MIGDDGHDDGDADAAGDVDDDDGGADDVGVFFWGR